MANFFYNPYKIENKQIATTTQNATLGFGKKKLANPNPRVVYRSTAITSQRISIDLLSTQKVDAVYIGNMNFVPGDTVYLRAGNVLGTPLKTIDLASELATGKINLHIIIPQDGGPGGPTWNYQYIWLDVTKAGGTYVQVGAFVPFRNYSFYDLGGPSTEADVINFHLGAIDRGGRLLNNSEKGYSNEIPYSGWDDRNIYTAVPTYETPISNIGKEQRALLKQIAESNYHVLVDWTGNFFGVARISNVKDETEVQDEDLQKANARLEFKVHDVIPKVVK